MPIACQAYYTVRERLRGFLSKASKPQLNNLSLLTFGLFAAGNSQLPRIAAKRPLLTEAASLTQRLRRLLMNPVADKPGQPARHTLSTRGAFPRDGFFRGHCPPDLRCTRSGRATASSFRGCCLSWSCPAAGLANVACDGMQRVYAAESIAERSVRAHALFCDRDTLGRP